MKTSLTLSILALAAASVAHGATTTLSFQNGANGYTSEVDGLITSGSADGSGTASPNNTPTKTTTLGLDGWNNADSPDAVALIRFDNIFGAGVAQVPTGATILSASLTLTSQSVVTSSSTPSGGPWGVAALLSPWTYSTTYNSYATNATDSAGTGGNRGPWFENGTATRAVAGIGKTYGSASTQFPNLEQTTVNVTSFAQAWSTGTLANNGLVVQSGFPGTSDGWIVRSGTHGSQPSHPILNVTYTTDKVTTTTLTQGVNGYTGSTEAYFLAAPGVSLPISDGGQITNDQSLDYGTANGNPSAAIKFDNITAPDGATLYSAYVVLTTSTGANARTPGTWNISKVNSNWDLNSTTDVFDNTTYLSNITGAISGAQAYFDVTSDVSAILAGTTQNTGWLISSAGTTDGWNIFWNGNSDPSVRPELVLTFTSPAAAVVPEPGMMSLLVLAPLALRRRR